MKLPVFKQRRAAKLARVSQKNENEAPVEKYVWYRDKKIIGTVILLLAVAMQIFAFLKVPFFTTINGYTIGMLFGYYSPFFYGFVVFIALGMIFGRRVRLPHYLRLNVWTYWGFALLVIFIASSLSYYQQRIGWTTIGAKAWDATSVWFEDFRSDVWYTPANTNGGVIGAIFYAFLAMCVSGIGVIVITIVLLLSLGAYACYRIYRKVTDRKNKVSTKGIKASANFEATQEANLSAAAPVINFNEHVETMPAPSSESVDQAKTDVTPLSDVNELPFDDPFSN